MAKVMMMDTGTTRATAMMKRWKDAGVGDVSLVQLREDADALAALVEAQQCTPEVAAAVEHVFAAMARLHAVHGTHAISGLQVALMRCAVVYDASWAANVAFAWVRASMNSGPHEAALLAMASSTWMSCLLAMPDTKHILQTVLSCLLPDTGDTDANTDAAVRVFLCMDVPTLLPELLRTLTAAYDHMFAECAAPTPSPCPPLSPLERFVERLAALPSTADPAVASVGASAQHWAAQESQALRTATQLHRFVALLVRCPRVAHLVTDAAVCAVRPAHLVACMADGRLRHWLSGHDGGGGTVAACLAHTLLPPGAGTPPRAPAASPWRVVLLLERCLSLAPTGSQAMQLVSALGSALTRPGAPHAALAWIAGAQPLAHALMRNAEATEQVDALALRPAFRALVALARAPQADAGGVVAALLVDAAARVLGEHSLGVWLALVAAVGDAFPVRAFSDRMVITVRAATSPRMRARLLSLLVSWMQPVVRDPSAMDASPDDAGAPATPAQRLQGIMCASPVWLPSLAAWVASPHRAQAYAASALMRLLMPPVIHSPLCVTLLHTLLSALAAQKENTAALQTILCLTQLSLPLWKLTASWIVDHCMCSDIASPLTGEPGASPRSTQGAVACPTTELARSFVPSLTLQNRGRTAVASQTSVLAHEHHLLHHHSKHHRPQHARAPQATPVKRRRRSSVAVQGQERAQPRQQQPHQHGDHPQQHDHPLVTLLSCMLAAPNVEQRVSWIIQQLVHSVQPTHVSPPPASKYIDALPRALNDCVWTSHVVSTFNRNPLLVSCLEVMSQFGSPFCEAYEVMCALLSHAIGTMHSVAQGLREPAYDALERLQRLLGIMIAAQWLPPIMHCLVRVLPGVQARARVQLAVSAWDALMLRPSPQMYMRADARAPAVRAWPPSVTGSRSALLHPLRAVVWEHPEQAVHVRHVLAPEEEEEDDMDADEDKVV